MAELRPIYRGKAYQFPFFMRDAAGVLVPLDEVTAVFKDSEGTELAMSVTDMTGDDAGKFLLRLEPEQTSAITENALSFCIEVVFSTGDEDTVLDTIVRVEEC